MCDYLFSFQVSYASVPTEYVFFPFLCPVFTLELLEHHVQPNFTPTLPFVLIVLAVIQLALNTVIHSLGSDSLPLHKDLISAHIRLVFLL